MHVKCGRTVCLFRTRTLANRKECRANTVTGRLVNNSAVRIVAITVAPICRHGALEIAS